MEEITLFESSKEDMKLEYPELAEYDEFKELSARDVRFCWLVGSRLSELRSYPKKGRMKTAAKTVYGQKACETKRELIDMMEGSAPDRLVVGIKRMATFNPSTRIRAKFADEYIFDTLNTIIVISEAEIMAMDFDDKKKYADLMLKVSADMPSLVKRMEGGYGIKVVGKKRNKAKVVAKISDIQ